MTRLFSIAACVAFVFIVPITARAGDLSKEACIDAHGRGQDAKDQGKLTLARKLFLSCAQTSCPALVSNDCARFADDLGRQQPSITLTARDGNGADLPDTSVYVDDILVTTRLDDGRPHDLDPGKHVIRFAHDGHGQVVTIVIGSGEQARAVAVVFGTATPPVAAHLPPAQPGAPAEVHPYGSRALMLGGLAVTVAGAAFATFELMRVPSTCSISTNQCAAAPGDRAFADAQSSVHLANLGWTATGLGLAAAIGGTIWYVTGAHHAPADAEHLAVTPWAAPGTGGLTVGGAW